jgi:hypothetical protein
MDLKNLLKHFEKIENKQIYCNKSKEDISGILYFNEDTFQENSNFLETNENNDKLYSIKKEEHLNIKQKDNFKNFSYYINHYIDFDKYNFSKSYNTITDCILNILKYDYNYGRNLFFNMLLKKYDQLNLFKLYNYKKFIKKNKLRSYLINKEDNNEYIKQLYADYLNLNIVIFTNDKFKLFYKDRN